MNKNKMIILVAIIMVIMLCPKNVFANEEDDAKCDEELALKITPERNYTAADPYLKITISANKKATIKYKIIKIGDSTDIDDSNIDDLFKDKEYYDGTTHRKLKYSLTEEISGKSDSHTIKLGKKPKAIYVFAELAEPYSFKSGKDTIKCRAGKIALSKSNNIKIINKNNYNQSGTGAFSFYTIPGKTEAEENKMYGTTACEEFRNGKHKKTEQNVDEKYKAGGQASEWWQRASKYFPYCFDSSGTRIRFSQAKIREIKNKFIETFNAIKRIQELDKSKENQEYDEQLAYVKNPVNGFEFEQTQNADTKDDSQYLTEAGILQCDNGEVEQTEFEDKKFYSSENEIVSNDLCNVKCYETFVTTYDPPITSSSGLCFSYKVTVRSKVYCKTKINKDNLKWPEGVSICASMGAECNGNKKETQAGPSDNFDSCVKSCDGGKYSQKCVDKCYNKVYKTNEDKEINTDYNKLSSVKLNDIKSDSLVLYNNKNNVASLTNVKYAENHKNDQDWCENKEDKDPYHYQWDGSNCIDVKESCDSRSDIMNNGDNCAEYFYKAKNQEPFGSYKHESSGYYTWKVDFNADYAPSRGGDADRDAGADGKRKNADSVFNSVKRAAKYYMRSVAQTKSLLRSFYALDGSRNGAGGLRYYNIDDKGIKRQNATGWHCKEVCKFYPTSGGSVGGNGCVYSAKEAKKYYDNQTKLNNAQVKECEEAATANCSEEVSTFEIGANNESKNESAPKRSYDADDNRLNNSNQPSKNNENRSENPTDDIFRSIESYKDYYSGEKNQSDGKGATNCVNGICYDSKEEDGNPSNGINGICYGNKYPYHDYKTTITFPGACINDKSGNITDDLTKCDTKRSVNGEYGTLFADQYCLLYNSKAYNSKWWYYKAWGAEKYQKKYGKEYSKSDEVREYNIKSHIEKFGKFNWSVETQCFYGTEDSTAPIDDYVYKVIKVGEAFTKYKEDKIPFNFTKEAKINTIPSDTTDDNAKTYSINPEKYVDYINTTEKELFETPEFASSECPGCDYHIKLSGDQLLEIRKYYTSEKKRDYTEYNGTFKEDKTIKGLVHYTSDVIDYLRDHYKLRRNENSLNRNNYYYNSSVDLYAANK